MTSRIVLVVVLTVSALVCPAPAEPPASDPKIAALLEPFREKHKFPGLVGAIVQGGKVTAAAAVGVRKDGEAEPFTVRDRVHIGSNTKAMTATLAAILVDDKKLRWDSTIGAVFPDLKPSIHEDYHGVTLQQLVTHRGGVKGNLPWPFIKQTKPPPEQRVDAIVMGLKDAPAEKPGTRFEYSNLGYVIVGAMAEKVTGKSWEHLMQEMLFRPLGMTTAGFGPPGAIGKLDEPWGHRQAGEKLTPGQGDNPPVIGPAGRVHCTISDWAKFVNLHLQAARGQPRLVSAEGFHVLHTPGKSPAYAAGWGTEPPPWTKDPVLWHNGSNTFWFAKVYLVPKQNLAVLAATNFGGRKAEGALNEVLEALARHAGVVERAK